jgi:hypothetical protein
MDRAERWLVLLLRVSAGVLLLATAAIFLPTAWMQATHHALGLGELPDLPVIQYLTRSLSGLYAFHGLFVLYVSFDVRRYLPLIRFVSLASALGGLCLLAIDLAAGMPWFWTLGEGPSLVLFYGIISAVSLRVQP